MELLFAAPHQHNQPNDAVSKANGDPTALADLVFVLDRASHNAKCLLASTPAADPSETLSALASLKKAQQMIGSFLAQFETQPSIADGDEPMSDRREGEEDAEMEGGEGSRIIDEVEEGMRECVLQSKRRKRQLSPPWLAGRAAEQREELSSVETMDRRQSSLDLVFQFHA